MEITLLQSLILPPIHHIYWKQIKPTKVLFLNIYIFLTITVNFGLILIFIWCSRVCWLSQKNHWKCFKKLKPQKKVKLRALVMMMMVKKPYADVAAAVAAASNTAVVVVVNCTEPDIVASTKASIQTDQGEAAIILDAVAPPRSRRCKPLAPNPPTMVSLPAAPASTIELPVVAVAVSQNVPIAIVSPLPVSISAPSLCPPTTNSIPTLVAAAPSSPAS